MFKFDNLYKFFFYNARPMCKNCCYFKNGMLYLTEILNKELEKTNNIENIEKEVDNKKKT